MLAAQQSLGQAASALAARDWDALTALSLSDDVPLGWRPQINWVEVGGTVIGVVGVVLAWLALPK